MTPARTHILFSEIFLGWPRQVVVDIQLGVPYTLRQPLAGTRRHTWRRDGRIR